MRACFASIAAGLLGACVTSGGPSQPGGADGGLPAAAIAGEWMGRGTREAICTGACSAPVIPCSSMFPCSDGRTCNADAVCEGPLDTGPQAGTLDLLFQIQGGVLLEVGATTPDCSPRFDVVGNVAVIVVGARCDLEPCAGGVANYVDWDYATLQLTGTGTATWTERRTQHECGGAVAGGNDEVTTWSADLMRVP